MNHPLRTEDCLLRVNVCSRRVVTWWGVQGKPGAIGLGEWRRGGRDAWWFGIVGDVERCRSARFSGRLRHVRASGDSIDPFPLTVASRLRCGANAARARKGLSMFSRLPRVLVASAAVVALSAPLGVPAYAAASKRAVTKKPTAADLRRKAVLDLYARQKDLQYRYLTNRTTTLLVPKEGPKVFTGVRLDFALRSEASDQATGSYLDMRPEQYESFDLRIASISTSTAVLRVCERTSGFHVRKSDNQRSDPNESAGSFTTDLELTAIYSAKTKRWLIAKALYLEPVEGESKCADGR